MARGRKSSLTAKIDNYSTGGEIGIKKTSSIGNSDNHRLTLIRLFKINVLIMVVPREYGLREGCKPSTIFQDTTRLSGVAPWRDERPITPYFQRD